MALTHSNPGELGALAPDFNLKAVDDENWSLDRFKGRKALLVIFMCNHCPYVIAVQNRINELAKTYMAKGAGVIGINSNDSKKYADDSFENMKKRAREQGYVFPYAVDETQEVAKAYGAVCTPDFFLYEPKNGRWVLAYRGRMDDSWKDPSQVRTHDLADAMDLILAGKPVPREQHSSMGCSIKWK